MTVTINGTSGITTPGVSNTGASTVTGNQTVSGTGTFASTISVGNATPSASGSGITFPASQSASSDANTLDDYEEGTWTPVPKFNGGNAGMSYTSAGTYIKIGKLVHVTATFSITSNGSSTGTMTIEGLPFSASNYQVGALLGDGFTFNGASIAVASENIGTTALTLTLQQGGTGGLGGYTYLTQTAISSGGKRLDFTYFTAN